MLLDFKHTNTVILFSMCVFSLARALAELFDYNNYIVLGIDIIIIRFRERSKEKQQTS